MKVLIIHNKYKQHGGEDTVVEQEFIAYKRLGYEVELYFEDNKSLTIFDILFSFFNFKSARKLKKKIAEFKPNVIHIHNIIFKLSPSILWVIPKETKIFFTIHNYRFLCPSGTLFHKDKINHKSKYFIGLIKNILNGVYQDSVLKTLILTLIFRIHIKIRTFKRVNTFVFLTPFSQQLHQNWFKSEFEKAIVKPNFLTESKNTTSSIKEIDLLYIGRFSEEKGLKTIIEVLKKFNQLNIALIGDGPLFKKLKEECKYYEHIVFYGQQPRGATQKLLSKSKFLIFPSIWYEGMPMTIIEAFSLGVPVICKNIGAMKSMVVDNTTGKKYEESSDLEDILVNINSYNLELMSIACKDEFQKKYSESVALENLKKLVND